MKNQQKLNAGVEKRKSSLVNITTAPNGETIVSMLEFHGTIFVATNKNVYELKEKTLVQIKEWDAKANS